MIEDRFSAWVFQESAAEVGQAGPLAGYRAGVKDNVDVSGMPTGVGFAPFADCVAPRDASIVAALRSGGATILGKTAMTEFAGMKPAATRNPHDPQRTPGGSSSGSAAAAAAGDVDFAVGTQSAGSIIRPAAYCGVVGFKSTFGRINTRGIFPLAPTLDTAGLLARNMTILDKTSAVALDSWQASPSEISDLTVEIMQTPDDYQTCAASHEMMDRCAGELSRAGYSIRRSSLPHFLSERYALHHTIFAYEASRTLGSICQALGNTVSAQTAELVQTGLNITFSEYAQCVAAAEEMRKRWDDYLDDDRVVLTFAAPGEAPLGLAYTGSFVFNYTWTLLHVPALTLPYGQGPSSMPLGVQFLARRGSDERLLGFGRAFEAELMALTVASGTAPPDASQASSTGSADVRNETV